MDEAPIKLLGPVAISSEGKVRPVAGRFIRTVLAILALREGEVVSASLLADVLWGDHPPSTAANTLQRHVSSARALLPPGVLLVARQPGYALARNGAAPLTDVGVAEEQLARARATDSTTRETLLGDALTLWRGEPLADVCEAPYIANQTARLTRLRTDLERLWVSTRLDNGDGPELVTRLEDRVTVSPYDEEAHGQLMLALYRSNRQAEALAVGRRLRDTLVSELGIDPGPEIVELEVAILRHDASLLSVPRARRPMDASTGRRLVPAQLPTAVRGFTGRRRELTRLDTLARATRNPRDASVTILTITGAAGVGKTALALRWAHRLVAAYPDGQLFANLRGFDPERPPQTSATVVRGFLTALGISPARIPDDPDQAAARLRTELADRRVLMVLDNVRDAAQVRPLLPGSPGCLVVVTSRRPLDSLAALEGARPLSLGLLDDAEAHALLTKRLGRERVAADTGAADIVAACGGLALALAVVAGRAAGRPNLVLSEIAAELKLATNRLDAVRGEDQATDLRTVLSCSYGALTPGAAALLRQLAVHPGPDLSDAAAASLTGSPAKDCDSALHELTATSLATEERPGRFSLHDLVRLFAWERLRDSEEEKVARLRLLDHYLHTAHAGALLVGPLLESIDVPPPSPRVSPEPLHDLDEAARWFETESSILIRLVEDAALHGLPRHAWQLAWCIDTQLHRTGRLRDEVRVHSAALAAARQAGERHGTASVSLLLARPLWELGDLEAARTAGEEALAGFESLGFDGQRAQCHVHLGVISAVGGDLERAAEHFRLALRVGTDCDDAMAVGAALCNLAEVSLDCGDLARPLGYGRWAVRLCTRSGNSDMQAAAWSVMAACHRRRGDDGAALDCLLRAAGLWRRVGNLHPLADALRSTAEIYHERGDAGAARDSWEEALTVLLRLDHPDADDVRARLAGSTS